MTTNIKNMVEHKATLEAKRDWVKRQCEEAKISLEQIEAELEALDKQLKVHQCQEFPLGYRCTNFRIPGKKRCETHHAQAVNNAMRLVDDLRARVNEAEKEYHDVLEGLA